MLFVSFVCIRILASRVLRSNTCLKSNGGVYQGWLGPDGNRAGRANAKASLTARPTRRAGAKAEVSDPTTIPGGERLEVRSEMCVMFHGSHFRLPTSHFLVLHRKVEDNG